MASVDEDLAEAEIVFREKTQTRDGMTSRGVSTRKEREREKRRVARDPVIGQNEMTSFPMVFLLQETIYWPFGTNIWWKGHPISPFGGMKIVFILGNETSYIKKRYNFTSFERSRDESKIKPKLKA